MISYLVKDDRKGPDLDKDVNYCPIARKDGNLDFNLVMFEFVYVVTSKTKTVLNFVTIASDGDEGTQKIFACENLLDCIIVTFYCGVRSGGGVGDCLRHVGPHVSLFHPTLN